MSTEWPESREPLSHETTDGDHLSRVAATHGRRAYRAIWEHGENAALRASRHTPHVLAPGDRVFVPAVIMREVERPTEQRHRFRATLSSLVLRVRRQHWDGSGIVEPPTGVTRDGKPVEFAVQGEVVTVPIEPLTTRCVFTKAGSEVSLQIGFLRPVDSVPGFRERLNNLGYRAGDSDDARQLDIRSAVEEFQCDQQLSIDGKCGPVTQQRLLKVHGC